MKQLNEIMSRLENNITALEEAKDLMWYLEEAIEEEIRIPIGKNEDLCLTAGRVDMMLSLLNVTFKMVYSCLMSENRIMEDLQNIWNEKSSRQCGNIGQEHTSNKSSIV